MRTHSSFLHPRLNIPSPSIFLAILHQPHPSTPLSVYLQLDGTTALSLNLLGIGTDEAPFPLTSAGYGFNPNSPSFAVVNSPDSQYSFPLMTPLASTVADAIQSVASQKQRPNLSRCKPNWFEQLRFIFAFNQILIIMSML